MSLPIVVSLCDFSGSWARPFADLGYPVVCVDPKHGWVDHGGAGYTVGALDTGKTREIDGVGLGLGMTAAAFASRVSAEGTRWIADLLELPCDVTIWGVLAAAPCTDFASSGARWFAAKDADGRTAASVSIVRDCLRVVEVCRPTWWVLENPVGRIQSCVPELGAPLLRFDPCDYAGHAADPASNAYTKRTALYGSFSPDLQHSRVEPVMYEKTKADGTVTRGSWMWATLGGKSERTKELRSNTPDGFATAFAEAQDWAYGPDFCPSVAA
jgi:hypothetical protein